ncbi:MAG: hypothetical protein ACYDCN_05325 [Bacteroidia bacterium]
MKKTYLLVSLSLAVGDVNGRINVSNGVIQRGGSAITSMSDLGLYSQVSGNFIRFVTNNGNFNFYTNNADGISYNTPINPPVLAITNDGRTIINSTAPISNNLANSPFVINNVNANYMGDNRLFEVKSNGTVYSREVQVQITQFPDYVFKKGYKLMPLSEVEKFIQLNKHLPNVMSAKEVEQKGGAPLGQLQKANLEKTEELYLYIIELNKQVQQLKEQVKKLESKK